MRRRSARVVLVLGPGVLLYRRTVLWRLLVLAVLERERVPECEREGLSAASSRSSVSGEVMSSASRWEADEEEDEESMLMRAR